MCSLVPRQLHPLLGRRYRTSLGAPTLGCAIALACTHYCDADTPENYQDRPRHHLPPKFVAEAAQPIAENSAEDTNRNSNEDEQHEVTVIHLVPIKISSA